MQGGLDAGSYGLTRNMIVAVPRMQALGIVLLGEHSTVLGNCEQFSLCVEVTLRRHQMTPGDRSECRVLDALKFLNIGGTDEGEPHWTRVFEHGLRYSAVCGQQQFFGRPPRCARQCTQDCVSFGHLLRRRFYVMTKTHKSVESDPEQLGRLGRWYKSTVDLDVQLEIGLLPIRCEQSGGALGGRQNEVVTDQVLVEHGQVVGLTLFNDADVVVRCYDREVVGVGNQLSGRCGHRHIIDIVGEKRWTEDASLWHSKQNFETTGFDSTVVGESHSSAEVAVQPTDVRCRQG